MVNTPLHILKLKQKNICKIFDDELMKKESVIENKEGNKIPLNRIVSIKDLEFIGYID